MYEYISSNRPVDDPLKKLPVPIDIVTFNALAGHDGLTQYLPGTTPFREEILADIEGAHFFISGDLVSRVGGDHIGGKTYKLDQVGTQKLDFIDAHLLSSIQTIVNLDEFSSITEEKPDTLAIQGLQNLAAEFSSFFMLAEGVDSHEAAHRIFMTIAGVVYTYISMDAQDRIATEGALDELLSAVFTSLSESSDGAVRGLAWEQLAKVSFEEIISYLSDVHAVEPLAAATLAVQMALVAIDETFNWTTAVLEMPPAWRERMPDRLIEQAINFSLTSNIDPVLDFSAYLWEQLTALVKGTLPTLSTENLTLIENHADTISVTLSTVYHRHLAVLIKVHDSKQLVISGDNIQSIDAELGKYQMILEPGSQGAEIDIFYPAYSDLVNVDSLIDFYLVPIQEMEGSFLNVEKSTSIVSLLEYDAIVYEQSPPDRSILGDYEWIDFNEAEAGIQVNYDDLGNPRTDPEKPVIMDDILKGSDGNDSILSGGGQDTINAMSGDDDIDAGQGDDVVNGMEGQDWIQGGEGSDILMGDDQDDRVYATRIGDYMDILNETENTTILTRDWLAGGEGNDLLVGSAGENGLSGGAGNDIIYAGSGNDSIMGDSDISARNTEWNYTDSDGVRTFINTTSRLMVESDYDDIVYAGAGNDWVLAEAGDDVIYGQAGNDFLSGDGAEVDSVMHGNDVIDGGEGEDILKGGGGNDLLYGGTHNDLLRGDGDIAGNEQGDDDLRGESGDDELMGEGGNDTLSGGEGNDQLLGDAVELESQYHGKDWLEGGSGDDKLWGQGESDTLFGGTGNDYIEGDYAGIDNQADDYLYGNEGEDTLLGQGKNDILYGGQGNDWLHGDSDTLDGTEHGKDTLFGEQGNDEIIGAGDDDILYGGAGDDTLFGDTSNLAENYHGNDYLSGGNGNDTLDGGSGDDTLRGGQGNDHMAGGLGNDSYIYAQDDGHDLIKDDAGSDDRLKLEYLNADDVEFSRHNKDLQINNISKDGSIIIQDWFAEGLIENIDLSAITLDKAAVIRRLVSSVSEGGEGNDVLTGTSVNDNLIGNSGADSLEGGLGNDYLQGGMGNDAYYYELGSGTDIIDENLPAGIALADAGTISTGFDILVFGEGIFPLQLSAERVDTDDSNLVMGESANTGDLHIIINSNDRVIIKDWFSDPIIVGAATIETPRIERIVFADGTIWEQTQLQQFSQHQPINYAPSLNVDINDKILPVNELFQMTLPENQFVDPEGDELTITITQNDGLVLPQWLQYDAAARTLSGLPGENDAGIVTVSITAADAHDNKVTDSFKLNVGNLSDDITGSSLDDTINGSASNDRIKAGAGNDTIYGNDGSDYLYGGSGDDTFFADKNYGRHPGNDFLMGDEGNDVLYAGEGNDSLDGGAGNDALIGDQGSDKLYGGTGNDRLSGGHGDDAYFFTHDFGYDIVDDQNGLNQLILDQTYAPDQLSVHLDGRDLVLAVQNTPNQIRYKNYVVHNQSTAEVENPLQNLSVHFSDGTIWDSALLFSKLTLPAEDTISGSTSDDTYAVDSPYDQIIEQPDSGRDQVFSSASFTLPEHIENITLTGYVSTNATGNDLDNRLIGNSGHNILDGRAGENYSQGGAGDDLYIMHAGKVGTIIEQPGEGIDKISYEGGESELRGFVIPENVENLEVNYTSYSLYAANMKIYGNELQNAIHISSGYATYGEPVFFIYAEGGDDLISIGYSASYFLSGGTGDDTIRGGAGDDVISGDQGTDQLVGGRGQDTYYFNLGDGTSQQGSFIIDSPAGSLSNPIGNIIRFGEGIFAQDIVFEDAGEDLIVHYSLNDKVRVVDAANSTEVNIIDYYQFSDNTTFTHAQLKQLQEDVNIIQGTDADDYLTGTAENENLFGGKGNDELFASSGDDKLDGGSGDDRLYGQAGNDQLTAGEGNDLLNGGSGDDLMSGGMGNDRYYVDSGADLIEELPDAGDDRVYSTVDHHLGEHLERLILQGEQLCPVRVTAWITFFTAIARRMFLRVMTVMIDYMGVMEMIFCRVLRAMIS